MDGIGDIYRAITIGITRKHRYRRRATAEDISDQMDSIGNVNGMITVGITVGDLATAAGDEETPVVGRSRRQTIISRVEILPDRSAR